MSEPQARERVLSGSRPTGKLHLGHLHGALNNWVDLQGRYECFFFVADWHSLTTDYANPAGIDENTRQMVADWLAVGVDAAKSTVFVQSRVKEHAELHLLLSMITPIGWLERNPTYKEMREELKNRDLATYGFLGYPVLQAADILIYKASRVPVGVDQVPHLELSREIARRFNSFYGEIFPVPHAVLTQTPKILGTDGRKMSKSFGNAIFLSDDPDAIRKKVLTMATDPARVRRADPGTPEICPVFHLHRLYSTPAEVEYVAQGCRTAGIGCVECKGILIPRLVESLRPIREKRETLLAEPGLIDGILDEGCARAADVARRTMDEVRSALGLPR